jgi:hypothetical protein
VPDYNPNASSHHNSDSCHWLLNPSILRINQDHILFVLLHLPAFNPTPHNHQHLQHPSVLRIHRTVLLLVCLQLPGIDYILNPPVLQVYGDLLLSDEFHVPGDELDKHVYKYIYSAGLHIQLQTVLLDIQAVLL